MINAGITHTSEGTDLIWIDKAEDFHEDGRLKRYGLEFNHKAIQTWLECHGVSEDEISDAIANLEKEVLHEHIITYLMHSQHEWIELDEENEPIEEVEVELISYINQ